MNSQWSLLHKDLSNHPFSYLGPGIPVVALFGKTTWKFFELLKMGDRKAHWDPGNSRDCGEIMVIFLRIILKASKSRLIGASSLL